MSDQRAGDAAAATGAELDAARLRAERQRRVAFKSTSQHHQCPQYSSIRSRIIARHNFLRLPVSLRLQRRLVVSQTGLCQKEACLSPQRADPSRETRLTLFSAASCGKAASQQPR